MGLNSINPHLYNRGYHPTHSSIAHQLYSWFCSAYADPVVDSAYKQLGAFKKVLDRGFTLVQSAEQLSLNDAYVKSAGKHSLVFNLSDCSVPHMLKVVIPILQRKCQQEGFTLIVLKGVKEIPRITHYKFCDYRLKIRFS